MPLVRLQVLSCWLLLLIFLLTRASKKLKEAVSLGAIRTVAVGEAAGKNFKCNRSLYLNPGTCQVRCEGTPACQNAVDFCNSIVGCVVVDMVNL